MITNFDENLGRVTEQLDALGVADSTNLIFLTDIGAAKVVKFE